MKGRPGLLALLPPHKTLFKAPPGSGLPIGNVTSQFFANVYPVRNPPCPQGTTAAAAGRLISNGVYLNELDQYIKRELKAEHYIRYVDDLILLSEKRDRLVVWAEKIEEFARERLRLEIHPQKRRLAPVSNGMDFLGYIVRPGYMLARNRVVRNFKRKMDESGRATVKDGVLEFRPELVKKANAAAASYLAHFNHADSYRLKTALADKYPFISEFNRVRPLVEPHYFPCLAAQYGFFKKALSGIEFYYDENGQLCFRDRPALLFFRVGRYYALYGEDAAAGARLFGKKETGCFSGLKQAAAGGSRRNCGPSPGAGPARAVFPAALEKKYATLAASKGYSVYIAGEKKDIRFNQRLLTRVLLRAYPGGRE